MHLMSGRWLGSSRDHPTIRSLEMLRSQTVEAVLSDTGNQMNSDSDPVGVGAGVLHRRAWQTPAWCPGAGRHDRQHSRPGPRRSRVMTSQLPR